MVVQIKGYEGNKLAFSPAWPLFLQLSSVATLVILLILVRALGEWGTEKRGYTNGEQIVAQITSPPRKQNEGGRDQV